MSIALGIVLLFAFPLNILFPKLKMCFFRFCVRGAASCRSIYGNMVKILLYIQKTTETVHDVAVQSNIRTNRTVTRVSDAHSVHAAGIRFRETLLLRFDIRAKAGHYTDVSGAQRRGSKGVGERNGRQGTGNARAQIAYMRPLSLLFNRNVFFPVLRRHICRRANRKVKKNICWTMLDLRLLANVLR